MVSRAGFAASQTEARSPYFWVPVTVLLLVLVPVQFYVGTLLLTPLRLFLLVMTPILGVKLLRGDFGRLLPSDYAMMLFLFFLTLSLGYHNPQRVVTFAGSVGVMVMGGYLAGRAGIRSAQDFRGFANAMAAICLVLLPLGFYEAILHNDSLILTWLAQFDFIETYNDSDHCCRLGMTRAQTVFIHPIHFGIFAASAVAIFFLANANHMSFVTRSVVTLAIMTTCVFSVSSGALIVMAFQVGMIGYTLMFASLKKQWKIFLWGALILYVILELNTTKVVFIRLAEMVAFSPGNAYTRQVMIDVGLDLMWANPILGYGPWPWPLPHWMIRWGSSIDNYWLVIAAAYGLPAFISVMTAIVHGVVKVGGDRLRKGSDLYYCRLAWSFLMVGLILGLATVFIWASLLSVVYMLVGAGMFLMYATEPDAEAVPDTAPARSGARYTRFPGRVSGAGVYARSQPSGSRRTV